MSAAAAVVPHGIMLSPEGAAGRKGKAEKGTTSLLSWAPFCGIPVCKVSQWTEGGEGLKSQQLLLRSDQVQLHQLPAPVSYTRWDTNCWVKDVGLELNLDTAFLDGLKTIWWSHKHDTQLLWSGNTHLGLLNSTCVTGASLPTDRQFNCHPQLTRAITMDSLRTIPFWLCLASGSLHLKTWLRKHFMKYSSVEQDHIKHFLPFHTGFGIKFYIECFSIFSYLWPGSKTKSSLKAHGLTACVPPAHQRHQVMLLHVRKGFPTGQSQSAKSTPRSLNTTQPPVPPARCISLPSQAQKHSSKANAYKMTKTTHSAPFPLWEEEEKIKRWVMLFTALQENG